MSLLLFSFTAGRKVKANSGVNLLKDWVFGTRELKIT